MDYEIRLEGLLGEEWAEWFESSALVREGEGVTLLVCDLADQAALFGLLRKVRDLGLPLLSVHRLEPRRSGAN
ncbi:MAG TPA: hypothetical protein VMV90_02900, partial [Rectinemataceae bacterium]|nr:hypothetical protein [Rectinemataceae bacterium]